MLCVAGVMNTMNERADELALEAGAIVHRESLRFEHDWKKIFVTVKLWDGAAQETCWYQKENGDVEFFFIDENVDLSWILMQLQEATAKGDRKWITCLIEIGRDEELKIYFEYENRDRWARLHCTA